MLLTQTLLSFLTEAFWTDPDFFNALIVIFVGAAGSSMTWTVSDGFLTTAITTGSTTVPGLTNDLSQYTIAGLADYIAAQPGYSVTYVDGTDNATLGALVLLDSSGGSGQPMLGYTNLLYAYLEAQAYELEQLQDTIAAAPAQLSILDNGNPSASGFFLDTLGSYYGNIGRKSATESDTHYANRMMASIVNQNCNNLAMELAITRFTNQDTTVADVTTTVGGATYNGANTYNGAINYNSVVTYSYNQFDVTYSYDFSDGADPSYVQHVVTDIINSCRAAGNLLRNLNYVSP